MIVTIDGPAGAGKSSVARRLAQRLAFEFLDTGAMYRAVALAAEEAAISTADPDVLGEFAEQLTIAFPGDRVALNGRDVTDLIRSPAISRTASKVAEAPRVRAHLVRLQREIAEDGNYVCEGRDQGTVAFPDAVCKIFLTACPTVRARRRWQELKDSGREMDLREVTSEQKLRDLRDETRAVGRLVKSKDAIEICTDDKTLEEIVDTLEAIVREALGN